MASSSTRSTYTETIIRGHFPYVYYRILENDSPTALELITERFADTLDMDYSDLLDTLDPPRVVIDPNERRLVKDDIDRWHKRRQHYRNQPRSTNVWEAASRVSDVGAELFRCGRDEEAREWCDLADRMQKCAGRMLWEEKQAEQEDTAIGYGG